MRISGPERLLAVLGYLPLVAAILLLARVRRDSMFVQFHVRQSWVLFLLAFAVQVLLVILLLALGGLATILLTIMFLTWLVYGLLLLAGLFKAALGERYRMPVVADVALKMGL